MITSLGALDLQKITGEWTLTQVGPESFSGQSPPTGTLNVNVGP